MKIRNCELCSESAAVYCPSDAAYLCRSCDAKVHDANFLVARHVRQTLTGNTFPANSDSDSDCESACVSSTTSPPAKEYSGGKRDSRSSSSEVSSRNSQSMSVNYCKVEGILVNWSLKLGLENNGDVAVRTALRVCLDNGTKVLPFRVLLAASMWLGLKLKSVDTWRVLKRLEEISGVPAKIILAAESKLAREMRDERRQNRRRLELEEGWAEC